MRTFTDNEILSRVASLDTFKGWSDGLFEIYVRSRADVYDAFDDKVFTYVAKNGKLEFALARNCTTNAGSYGLKHFNDYNHTGCAVLKSDTIVYGSHAYGLHKGKPGYREVKGFPYFRDGNRNERAEEIGPEYHDVIGANIHRAGVNSTVIKNWSVACLVTANIAKFIQFLEVAKSLGYPPANVAIIREF
jgi:subtilisin family serine protease